MPVTKKRTVNLATQTTTAIKRATAQTAVNTKTDAGLLDVLGAPFYGPVDGRDSHGEYFAPDTDFQADLIPLPPVFYFHGSETGSTAELIGQTLDRWVDHEGVWFRVRLDLTNPHGRRLWRAAQQGQCFASTGAVPASIVKDGDGKILQWLIGELSLIDASPDDNREPANYYAIATPRMKAIIEALPDEQQRLFSNVYLIDKEQEKDKPMSKKAKLKAALEELLDLLTDDDDDEFMGKTKADDDTGDDDGDCPCGRKSKSGKCMCDGDDDTKMDGDGDMLEAMEEAIETTIERVLGDDDIMSKSATVKSAVAGVDAMQKEIASLKANLAARDHADWVNRQIKAGKVTPAEKPALLTALGKAHMTDARVKSGGDGMVKSLMDMVEARTPFTEFVAGDDADLKVAGRDQASTNDTVDEAYMTRLRSYISPGGKK